MVHRFLPAACAFLILFALPARCDTHADRLAAVVDWLKEDAELADASQMPDLAAARRADIASLQAHPPAETAPASHDDLLPPIPYAEGNPVTQDFFQQLKARILDPDKRFPKGPEGGKARSAEGWAFVVRATELLGLAQAFCHPQSTRNGDPALVAPILRRLAYFSEYMAKGGPVLGDFGPCGTIADAYLILSTCRPEILPTSIRSGMDQGIRNNADVIIEKNNAWFQPPGPATPCLVNSDVNLALALAIANRMFPSENYADAARCALDYIEPHILPDGGTNYVAQQNECPSYHNTAVSSLARNAQVTGDPKPLEMVKRLRWYYPLVVSDTGVIEWATAVSWHHYWNNVNCADQAAVVAELTNCPHNQRVANLGFKGNLWNAAYWNPVRKAAPFPDNYITYDRNIEGPRARFGRWSFVGTTRKTYDNRGKSSYVGCVIETGKPGSWQLDSALQDAGMEIRLTAANEPVGEHHGRVTLANNEPTTTAAVGENVAALGAVAHLGAYGKPATNWITRQAWFFDPERMVGLVTLEAGSDAEAAGIFGCLFLVSGRSNWGTRKELQDLGNGEFAYGAMRISIKEHDFSGFDHEYIDVMAGGLNQSSGQKSCRLMLLDDAATSGASTRYPKGTTHHYLVEIRPETSAPAKIQRLTDANGLLGFTVEEATDSYKIAFNPTGSPVTFAGGQGTLHRSGEKFRPDWLADAGPTDSNSPEKTPMQVQIPPGEIAVITK